MFSPKVVHRYSGISSIYSNSISHIMRFLVFVELYQQSIKAEQQHKQLLAVMETKFEEEELEYFIISAVAIVHNSCRSSSSICRLFRIVKGREQYQYPDPKNNLQVIITSMFTIFAPLSWWREHLRQHYHGCHLQHLRA